MCYLTLDEKKYSNSREFWKALIVNKTDGFTINEILSFKEQPTQKDLKEIYEIIKELGDHCLIKRIDNRFYILDNIFTNA